MFNCFNHFDNLFDDYYTNNNNNNNNKHVFLNIYFYYN